jgi:hypothetical protein
MAAASFITYITAVIAVLNTLQEPNPVGLIPYLAAVICTATAMKRHPLARPAIATLSLAALLAFANNDTYLIRYRNPQNHLIIDTVNRWTHRTLYRRIQTYSTYTHGPVIDNGQTVLPHGDWLIITPGNATQINYQHGHLNLTEKPLR